MNMLQSIVCDEVIQNPEGVREESIVLMVKELKEAVKYAEDEVESMEDYNNNNIDLEDEVFSLNIQLETLTDELRKANDDYDKLAKDNEEETT